MRFTKRLLQKNFDDLTDEEFRCIGKHFMKYHKKTKPPLVKCVNCRHWAYYDTLGIVYWQCGLNPCDDLETQEDRLMTNRAINQYRRCAKFERSMDSYNV